ncbi:MAG: serine/threonine protein kinase [Oscillospiraceae bacterium]|jgi:ABC-type glycerol-3-phosphate transport system substrate-binding protein|nr:serine/threonine protein kinase [Oscillospiraceae bacterium]
MRRCNNCFEEYSEEYELCPHCGYADGAATGEIFYLYPGLLLGGRYSVGQVLGFGGFGITYKAWDSKLRSVVAVKEYYPSGLANRAPGTKNVILFAQNRVKEYNHGLTRFLDEARNMAKFSSCRNIVNIYEYFEENNTAYLVMEYLDGITLGDFLKDNTLEPDDCIDIIRQVTSALREVHGQGVLHRDVSPDNIFICTNGAVKLIDFGAARFAADEDKLLTIILKPGFAPPEQYERVNVQGPWTDIYALGATLYYMATGVKPEESTNRKIQDNLPPPHVINAGIPVNISNTIMKALAVDRHMRFNTVEDFEKGLLGSKKVSTLAQEKKARKRRRLMGVIAAMLAVTAGASVFALTYNKQREEETLPDATIELRYARGGDAAADSSKEAALSAIAAAFRSTFPNVEIAIVGYGAGEYTGANGEDASGENAAVLFESSGLDDAVTADALDISDVIGDTEKADCWFLGKYSGFADGKKIPLGFTAPAVYVNTTLADPEDGGVSDISGAGQSLDEFLSERSPSYLGGTPEFFEVQAALPGRYRLLRLDMGEIPAEFADTWSLAPCGNDAQKAAKRFLRYMLSDNAQDYLHLRRHSGALPLNKRVLTTYCEVYTDFTGFFDNIDRYTIRE